MALSTLTEAWSAKITLTQRELIQLQEGRYAYVALGDVTPTGKTDGILIAEGQMVIFESGQVLRFRMVAGEGTLYRGAFV